MIFVKRLYILHNNIETKNTERKSLRNILNTITTVTREKSLGKAKRIRKGKRIISMLKSLARRYALVSFAEIQNISQMIILTKEMTISKNVSIVYIT